MIQDVKQVSSVMKPLHYAQQWLPAMLATQLGTGYLSESNPIKKWLANENTEYHPISTYSRRTRLEVTGMFGLTDYSMPREMFS